MADGHNMEVAIIFGKLSIGNKQHGSSITLIFLVWQKKQYSCWRALSLQQQHSPQITHGRWPHLPSPFEATNTIFIENEFWGNLKELLINSFLSSQQISLLQPCWIRGWAFKSKWTYLKAPCLMHRVPSNEFVFWCSRVGSWLYLIVCFSMHSAWFNAGYLHSLYLWCFICRMF